VTTTVLLAAVNKENSMTDTFDSARLLNHTLAHAPILTAGLPAAIYRTGEAPAAAAPPVFLTVEQVARALDISTRTVGRRIRDGIIRKVAIGGRLVRVSSAELQRLVAAAR
jgi:excisionase family DNA binding protein